MRNSKVLVLEDDKTIREQITELLEEANYDVAYSEDGEAGLTLALNHQYDIILLDLMLPNIDGLSILNILRKHCETPVIVVTAKGAEQERIIGLSAGADDYVTKPFNPQELLLRIEAILRRVKPSTFTNPQSSIRLDDLEVDPSHQSVRVSTQNIEFTPIQFNLLYTLLKNKGEVLPKAFLYQTAMNRSYGQHDRSLDMHVSRIRKKLHNAKWNGERIQTVHGKGYCLV